MAEFGVVQKTDGEMASVAIIRSEACKHCHACIPSLTDQTMILQARNECGAQPGDRVRISVTQSGFLSAVFILYVIPALVFLAAILVLSLFHVNDWITLLIACALVAASYLGIHQYAKNMNTVRYTPVLESIVTEETEEEKA